VEGDDMDVIISGRLLVDIIRNIPGSEVLLEETKTSVIITSGRSTFSLVKLPAETYPALPVVPDRFGSVPGQVFADATRSVCFAASSDASTPVLTTVMMEVNPVAGTLTFAATDKFCLAKTTVPYTVAESVDNESRVFLIPAKVLEAYGKNLAKESVIGLHADEGNDGIFGVSGGGENSTTRVYAGEYPKYAPLLEGKFTTEIMIDVTEVIESVKRVSLMAEGGQGIRLIFSEAALEVATTTRGGGDNHPSAREVLDVDFTGEELELVFNPSYLIAGLSHFDTAKVKMEMTAPGRPVKFTSGVADDPFVFLAMPLRV